MGNLYCYTFGNLITVIILTMNYLHYLQYWKDIISCLVNVYWKSFKIPYWRLVKYETLWNDTISEYFLKEL